MLYETVQWMAIIGSTVSAVVFWRRCNSALEKADFLYNAYHMMNNDIEAIEEEYNGVAREYQRMCVSNDMVYNEHTRMAQSLGLLWKEFLDEQDWSMVDSEDGE